MLVSVAMPTYNQEMYIIDAIEGVIKQETDFDIELIITNDNSPDNTHDIIEDYKKNNFIPDNIIIKYIKHEKNKGAIPNFAWTISQCIGQYVALCEGDDYWTDPLKLQKQVDFLERNLDYVLCFHSVNILNINNEIVEDFITNVPDKYEFRMTLALQNNYIHTPSVLFRNILKDELNLEEFKNSPIGDYFLYMLLTKYGKIGFINEVMAIYRYGVGVYSGIENIKQLKLNLMLYINLYSIEEDSIVKNHFFNKIQDIILVLENRIKSKQDLLNTRRHKLIEKIYRLIKPRY